MQMQSNVPEIKILDSSYTWEELSLWDYLQEGNIPRTWEKFFIDNSDILYEISTQLEKENPKKIYPIVYQVFRAFIPLDRVKLCLLGLDPYHNGSAIGLCFSVKPGNSINPSLRNIYKELKQEGYKPCETGDLTHWKSQGCLMLNTALTVMKGCAGSHTALWYEFSERVVKYVAENTKNVSWLLMGSKAHAFKRYITVSNGHSICETSHPSPFSAHKSYNGIPAFIGSDCFKQINKFLKSSHKKEIKW